MARLPRPPRPIPAPLELSPPPSPAPPTAAEFEERPPPIRMKLLFPYAVNRVFRGVNRAWGMALLGLLVLISIFWIFCLVDPEEARCWFLIFGILVYLIAATLLMKFMEEPAAAEDQLPPPPPQMDMC